jgi:hypothetical protein
MVRFFSGSPRERDSMSILGKKYGGKMRERRRGEERESWQSLLEILILENTGVSIVKYRPA